MNGSRQLFRGLEMSAFSAVNCICFVALLALLGCQRTDPELTEPQQTRDTDRSQVSHKKQEVDAARPDIAHEGRARRPLKIIAPLDDKQAAREPDLTIVWHGNPLNPPADAQVFVGSKFVGQGREGFAAALKALATLPKRGKLAMSYKTPPVFLSDSRDISEIPDPFSAWPDLDAAFSRLVSEREICVRAYKSFEGEASRPPELSPPIGPSRYGEWGKLGKEKVPPTKSDKDNALR